MDIFIKIIVCLFAGLGAGFGMGFAGLSATMFITPMLITFLNVEAYEAIGIALASDILASAIATVTYGKNKHLDYRCGFAMLFPVLLFTFVGSYIASLLPHTTLGGFTIFISLFTGLRFIFRPVVSAKESNKKRSRRMIIFISLLCGIVIGLVYGFLGIGGGLRIFMVLVSVLGYELKTAVGTSVFIMTFTAFAGATMHFTIGSGISDWSILLMCMGFTFFAAMIAAKLANKFTPKVMNRALGAGLTILCVTLITINFL